MPARVRNRRLIDDEQGCSSTVDEPTAHRGGEGWTEDMMFSMFIEYSMNFQNILDYCLGRL